MLIDFSAGVGRLTVGSQALNLEEVGDAGFRGFGEKILGLRDCLLVSHAGVSG